MPCTSVASAEWGITRVHQCLVRGTHAIQFEAHHTDTHDAVLADPDACGLQVEEGEGALKLQAHTTKGRS